MCMKCWIKLIRCQFFSWQGSSPLSFLSCMIQRQVHRQEKKACHPGSSPKKFHVSVRKGRKIVEGRCRKAPSNSSIKHVRLVRNRWKTLCINNTQTGPASYFLWLKSMSSSAPTWSMFTSSNLCLSASGDTSGAGCHTFLCTFQCICCSSLLR